MIGEDLSMAYAVQQVLARRREARGGVVVGRKVGLTSTAVQQQLGVDQPDYGVLFADMDVSGRRTVPFGRLIAPKVEAEVAFVLKSDLDAGDLDYAQARAAIDYAAPALEIVDSRIADWDISIYDTVADNGSSGLFVLGESRRSLENFTPADVRMSMYDGNRLVSQGNGAACLGDPINALVWLARTARDVGDPLRAGQIVLSGALGPMVPVTPGMTIRADIEPLGSVAVSFASEGER
ncbi:2-keto-4-pentenoate hydratase [Knoellia sp. DB2414S]|uniref:2-keto-4-pentenoate hydratase n=2 Tax=Knoellia koreensis TaxID=2730921 RepID=A0A849HH56_9MICO|nr:2-keto-4-pentenoate hydratase [Knoellia sp. DB2414S]